MASIVRPSPSATVVQVARRRRPAPARASTTTIDVILRCSMMFSASAASVSRRNRHRVARHHVARPSARGSSAVRSMCRRRSPSVMMPSERVVAVDDARHAEALARHLVDDVAHARCRRRTDRALLAGVHHAARRASAACRACRPGAGSRSPPAGIPSRRAASSPARRRAPARRSCWPSAPGSSDRLLR